MVSALDNERFGLNAGRVRPVYQPKNIRCKGCGAGLTVKDEHARMIHCDYCDSQLDISAEEQTVLGKNPERNVSFSLRLGDNFYHRNSRFEVIARMAFTEDDDVSDMTLEYLLYNPRMGTMWLGEYDGRFSLTSTSHVMPEKDVFKSRRGDTVKTHDGGEWVAEGVGVYELYYVDGALPWIAQVGDTIGYAEFADKSGSGRTYEVQRIENEVEYGVGRSLPLPMVRRATKKPELGKGTAPMELGPDAAQQRKWYMRLMMFTFLLMLINGAVAFYLHGKGEKVLGQSFPPAEVTEGVITSPFWISGGGNVTRITFSAPLSNAWMELQAQVVRDEALVVHQYEAGMEYYHGRSGGESWSEGSRTKSFLVKMPRPGNYRVHLQAVSARGNSRDATKSLHDVSVRVFDKAMPWGKMAIAAVFCLVLFLISFSSYSKWKNPEEDDDDD